MRRGQPGENLGDKKRHGKEKCSKFSDPTLGLHSLCSWDMKKGIVPGAQEMPSERIRQEQIQMEQKLQAMAKTLDCVLKITGNH